MKIILLTDEEIKIIKTALQYVYDSTMDIVTENRKILSEDGIEKLLEQANIYFDTQDALHRSADDLH